MVWSPTDDMLLVGCYDASGRQPNFVYFIFDADRQEEILTFDASSFGLSGYISDITAVQWTPDGEGLVVYHADRVVSGETTYWISILA
jgi:WD40 repeat protein